MAYTEITNITTAKNLLYDKLKTDLEADLEVTLLKQGGIDSFRSNHQNGSLVLHYDGSDYSDSESKNIVLQDRLMRIAAYIQIRAEKGLDYRDQMIDKILTSVSGIKFSALHKTGRVRPASDNYIAPEEQEKLMYLEHVIIFLVPAQFEQSEDNF